jgi:hypothetical protein
MAAITNLDIDQRIKLTMLTTKKSISRQEALTELINDKLKIRKPALRSRSVVVGYRRRLR